MQRYALDAAMPVLIRPDGAVQVGWDPRRAVLVRPPHGLSTAALAELLRKLQTGATPAALQARFGIDVSDLVAALVEAGVVRAERSRRRRSAAIRIHGRGPLSDLLAGALSGSDVRVTRSCRTRAAPPESTDLVVLADSLMADPRVVAEMHAARLPHLAVRVRDGTGLIGPLVVPGLTSCLDCADLHRSDRDAAWPAVAAQLRDAVGSADRATVLATAALALHQIDRVVAAVRLDDGGDGGAGVDPPAPPTLDTTLEFDVAAGVIVARRWSRHPDCPRCAL